ncbi:hypothetical protein ACHWQZ_G012630 [Mnemiopsis leidyi]
MFALAILFCTTVLVSGRRDRTVRVSSEVKDQILATDDADLAYQMYLNSYEDRDGPAMLKMVDPVTQQREEARKKRNFMRSLTKAKAHNAKFANGETRYKKTVNTFSVMDDEEKRAYLGSLNTTRPQELATTRLLGATTSIAPETLSWRSMGHVTDTFDQGDCGSCWTFPSVALIEFALKQVTGTLIQLSNQELLDCTYEYNREHGNHDGCDGGLYEHAWDFVMRTGHLAPLAKYTYKTADYKCDHSKYPNALKNKVKITGYKAVDPSEDGVMKAIQVMPLAVAIFVELELYDYYSGMYDGCETEHEYPDHAVLLTGYGTNYWEVRNSWGQDWGINGYFKFYRARGFKLCFLLDFAAYITYKDLSGQDVTYINEGKTTEKTETASTSSAPTSESKSIESTTAAQTVPPVQETSPEAPTNPKTTAEVDSSTTSAPATKPLTTDLTTSSVTESLVTDRRIDCTPGKYYNGSECAVCPEGTYSGYGARFCISCPEGTTSEAGSSSAGDCTEDQCRDVYRDCPKWARNGFCVNSDYISYMENSCRRSCFFCEEHCEAGYYRDFESGHCLICPPNTYSPYRSGKCDPCPEGSSSPEGSTDVTNCVREQPCEDTASDCMVYVPYGYCNSRKRIMESRCAKSCGFCSDQPDDCEDKYEVEVCTKLRSRGYCYEPRFIDMMRDFCGKTCGTCRGEDEGDGKDHNCVDTAEYAGDCPQWAEWGYCEYGSKYTAFMHQSCKKSCSTIVDTCGGRKEKEETPTPGYHSTTKGPTTKPTTETERPTTQPTTEGPSTKETTESQDGSTTSATSMTTDCWVTNTGVSDNVILSQPEFTTYNDCIELCKSMDRCRGIMVSPAYWAYRECFVLGEEEMADRHGWTAARRACFQPNYEDEIAEDSEKEDGVCADTETYAQDCPGWADSYCLEGEYVEFMEENCRDSCGFCERICEDLETNCVTWAAAGFCDSPQYQAWMRDNCAGSCGVCDEDVEDDASCTDHDSHTDDCPYWASQGYCTEGNHIRFMRHNCQRSCNTCGRGRGSGRARGSSRNRG